MINRLPGNTKGILPGITLPFGELQVLGLLQAWDGIDLWIHR
jgi:hypothetical protein